MTADILVVDDEEDIRDLVTAVLEDEGYETRAAANSEEAMVAINNRRPSLVILDIWLQSGSLDGLTLLDRIKALHPNLPVVMISGHGNIETAVSSIKRGAYDYIEKPFNSDRLILIAQRALETSKLQREVDELKQRTGEFGEIIGENPVIDTLRQNLEKIAETNSRVMIFGKSGSGKELAARTIHRLSSRSDGPFVALNGAIRSVQMEEELFGIEDENSTQVKVGALEEAHGGTLYLDEITDMPKNTQNKILRVLTDQTFNRVNGNAKVAVDIRIISSTTKNLEVEIAEGRFREDLFHRLNVVPLSVPSLSEYSDDIPVLIEYFMDHYSKVSGLPKRTISDEVMLVLKSHNWPGNVRQLRNNVERLMILTKADEGVEITPEILPAEVGSLIPVLSDGAEGNYLMDLPIKEAREAFEKDYLRSQLNRFSGNIKKTSEFIGMDRSSLHRKMRLLDLE